METKSQGHNGRSFLTEGLVLAGIPVLAYFLFYIFEAGYGAQFGIPPSFVTPNLGYFSFALLSILIFGFFALWIFDDAFRFLHEIAFKRPALKTIPRWAIFIALLFPFFIMLKVSYLAGAIFIFILVSFLALWDFVFAPWIKKIHSFPPRSEELEAVLAEKGILRILKQKIGIGLFPIFAFSLYLTFLSFSAGMSQAQREDMFLVMKTNPEQVVLRVYGDTMIVAPFDRETKIVQKTFMVRTVGDDPATLFRFESVGPLKAQ